MTQPDQLPEPDPREVRRRSLRHALMLFLVVLVLAALGVLGVFLNGL